jgi:hypothetical protein
VIRSRLKLVCWVLFRPAIWVSWSHPSPALSQRSVRRLSISRRPSRVLDFCSTKACHILSVADSSNFTAHPVRSGESNQKEYLGDGRLRIPGYQAPKAASARGRSDGSVESRCFSHLDWVSVSMEGIPSFYR